MSMGKKSKSIKKKSDVEKEQVNLRLPVDLVEDIERILFYARQSVPREKRNKLHKSKLYEIVFQVVLENYIEEKHDSLLSNLINKWGRN